MGRWMRNGSSCSTSSQDYQCQDIGADDWFVGLMGSTLLLSIEFGS